MKVFYHNDMDGITAARVILTHMRNQGKKPREKDFIKMDYAKEFPIDIIEDAEEVWIVDYSIEPEQMRKLLSKTHRVIWIDHHKSAIEKYNNFGEEILGLRADGIAGCVLTWWYIYGKMVETENFVKDYPHNALSVYRAQVPRYILLAGDWDVWDHLYGMETKCYTICFNARINNPFDDFSFNFLVNDIEKFTEDGLSMIEYRNGWADGLLKRYGFETKIDGIRAYVINLGNANSEFFGNLINQYDIVGTFCFNGDKWTTSLYSNKNYIDCAEICAKRNGGGHKGAAGFVSNEIPFKKEDWECLL